MFKSVLIIIAVIILLFVIKVVLQRLKRPDIVQKTHNKDTVQCSQCKTYITLEDAIMNKGQYFCNQQHLNDWKHSS